MIFKKSLLNVSLCVAILSMSGYAMADDYGNDSGDAPASIDAGHRVIGDDAYWGFSSKSDSNATPDNSKWNESEITADSIKKESDSGRSSVPEIRANAIQGAAISFGTQAGLASRASKLNTALKNQSSYYDKIFNFTAVQIEPGFLPPVISEAKDTYNQTGDDVVRAANTVYKIEFPARIVNVPPRWQSYLMIPFSDPSVPDKTLLPKTSAEKDLWDEYAKKGWSVGIDQANDEFQGRLGRLKRDFEGMLRFKKLYEEGLVTKPVLARSTLGITGGGDEMAVGERVIKITDKAKLNPNQSKWLSSDSK